MDAISEPLATATAESSTATSVKLASGRSLSCTEMAKVFSMEWMAQSKAAAETCGFLKRSKRSVDEEASGLRTTNVTQCHDFVVK